MATQFLIAGLGNPGPEYVLTRHNAGFWFIDRFVQEFGAQFSSKSKHSAELAQLKISGNTWFIVKPMAYMNKSGVPIRSVAQYYNIDTSHILVAHDELDFSPGVIRFKAGGGHGGHNGLRDIIQQLGSNDFKRLRIGIGRSGNMIDYVLKSPSRLERDLIDQSIEDCHSLIPDLMGDESQKAVQKLHGS
ncbi:MAG: aminoacyl-tRNA hydrolase [Gammaproteobacteria bacterium]|nr:aminoacyl-tRNA hydrolase [Gammaproteobacteria bacterium]